MIHGVTGDIDFKGRRADALSLTSPVRSVVSDDLHSFSNNLQKESKYHFFQTPTFIALFAYFIWIWIGIIFYMYYDGFTMATAFYYAIEAGLSVGFCEPSEIDDWSRLFTTFYVLVGSSLVAGLVCTWVAHVISLDKNTLEHQNVEAKSENYRIQSNESIVGYIYYLWFQIKLSIGWYSKKNDIYTIFYLLFWVSVGVVYGVYLEGWTFITSLYWSVTSLSTGGLLSAPCESYDSNNNCVMNSTKALLMALYMMIGIPLYAITLGRIARRIAYYCLSRYYFAQSLKPIREEDFLFAANLLSEPGSQSLTCGEFILLDLMRSGIVDASRIQTLKDLFIQYDVDKVGSLDMTDLIRLGAITPQSEGNKGKYYEWGKKSSKKVKIVEMFTAVDFVTPKKSKANDLESIGHESRY